MTDRPTPTASTDASTSGPTAGDELPDGTIVDFRELPRRLQTIGGALALLTLLGCIVEGVISGLTFALMGRWLGFFVAALLLSSAIATGLHAFGGADRAGRRGERLSSPDVGLSPRRLATAEDEDAIEGEDAIVDDGLEDEGDGAPDDGASADGSDGHDGEVADAHGDEAHDADAARDQGDR